MEVDFARKPVLRGERVILRPFAPGDSALIARIIEDPEVQRLTGSAGESFTDAELEQIYAQRICADDRLDLAVVDRISGELVGEVVLNEWDERNRSCNFRTLIGPAGRDRGLGTEAVRLIVGHGFTDLGLHRIHLYAYTFNPRARRVYEKAGFRCEGVDREVLLDDGVWVDAVRMSILEHEWR
ncbi:MAG TPA: GNAT family protein [Actinoplanes sp.]|nr:GNAT family protein [Actinoplanes sp.]